MTHLAEPGITIRKGIGIEMIEYKGVGWDAYFECRNCGINEHAYVPENAKRDKELFGHKDCGNYTVNFKRRFIEFDPDYVSLYGCNGCEECNDV